MTESDDLFAKRQSSNERIIAAMERLDSANIARGLPADSFVIFGDEALAAAEELQAANREQGEIIEQLLARPIGTLGK